MEEEGFTDCSDAFGSGVYALTYRGKVIYIGQSVMMMVRIASHLREKKTRMTAFGKRKGPPIVFDGFWCKPCHSSKLDAIEKELIEKYRPKYNIKHKPTYIAVDMKAIVASLAPPVVPFTHPLVTGKIERRI